MRDRERGSAPSQMQKSSSARKFHFEPPFTSFDHLVGGGEQLVRHGEAERLRRLEIDRQLEFHSLLHRQVGWLLPFENAPGVAADKAKRIGDARSIADQPAIIDKLAQVIACRKRMARCQPDKLIAPTQKE